MRIALSKHINEVRRSKSLPTNLHSTQAVQVEKTLKNQRAPFGTCSAASFGYEDSSEGEHHLEIIARNLYASEDCTAAALDDLKSRKSAKFDICASLLQLCAKSKALFDGKLLHAQICRFGYDANKYIGNCLVLMYGDCGSVENARAVFDAIAHPNSFSWNLLMKALVQNGNLHDVRIVFGNMPDRDLVSWNTMIAALTRNGYGRDVLDLFFQMELEGIKPDKITFVCTLDACANLESLEHGQIIHVIIADLGYEQDVMVATALINMYGKCKSVCKARREFNKMQFRDVIVWSAVIAAFAQNGHGKEALDHFRQMQLEGVQPDMVSFSCALDVCASMACLVEGQKIHAALVGNGYDRDTVVGNTLVKLYSKCGNLQGSLDVFYQMLHRDVSSWNAIIIACTKNGYISEGLDLVYQMHAEGAKPDKITHVCVLDACANLAALEEGQKVHAAIVETGYDGDAVLINSLLNMYGKCGCVHGASGLFSKMLYRDVVPFSAMIAAYSQIGHGGKALELFRQLQLEAVKPDNTSFSCVLDACSSVAAIEEGQRIHAAIIYSECDWDNGVWNALLTMYCKCGNCHLASEVMRTMPGRDVVNWNAMIAAFGENEGGKRALDLFCQLQLEGKKPDKVTFSCVIDICARSAAFTDGQNVHAALVEVGYEQDVTVGTVLINMYGQWGRICDSKCVFSRLKYHNTVSWNAMITACAHSGHGEVFDLLHQMQVEGIQLDKFTLISCLDACINPSTVEEGQRLHTSIICIGCEVDVMVSTALVNMYGKCGSLHDAKHVFRKMLHRNTVTWNAMIAASGQNGQSKEALDLYHQMQGEAVRADNISIVHVLDACANLSALEQGQEIHAAMLYSEIEEHVAVGTALIDIYGKCGNPIDARNVFSRMPHRDIVCWNAMMSAFAHNGLGKESLHLLLQMQHESVKPDEITFLSILTACSHTGSVADGRLSFISINRVHDISYTEDHYLCMIDLLARAGQLDDAEDLVNKMPFTRTSVAWSCLLGACRIHHDLERGLRSATHCFELETQNFARYMIVSHIYWATNKWQE